MTNQFDNDHLYEFKSIAILKSDIDNNIVYISPGYERISGYSENELIGKKPTYLSWNSKNIFNLTDIWEELDLSGRWEGVFKNKKKNGEPFFVKVEIIKTFDSTNKFNGYTALNTEITDIITLPHMFTYENTVIKTLLKNPNEIIAICLCENKFYEDVLPRFIDVSDKLLTILGCDKTDLINSNKAFNDILFNESKYYKNIELLMSDYKNNSNITVDILDTNNKLNTFRISITEFYFQGNLSRMFKLTNISDEINTHKKLEELNTQKNNFLANFSHEIKTPLNATIGFIELMKMNETDSSNLEYFDVILENSKHILDLMNDAIDFATIDNNNLEIVERSFAPKDIQSTIEIFYAKSLSKEIDFTVYMSPKLPLRMTQDILRIKQIISNLLSNALKFTDFGGKIIIDISYNKNMLILSVEDSGIGMTDNQIDKIFHPFVQASEETELFYGGTGLGLSIVEKIISAMGGTISITSKLGVGTKFIVNIPVHNIINNKSDKKLTITEIKIFTPSFSKVKTSILKKYLKFFTDTKVSFIKILDENNLNNDDLLIIFKDDIDEYVSLEILSKKYKILLIRKMNDLIDLSNVTLSNLQEISLPLIGSKIYNGLNALINNQLLIENNINIVNDINLVGHIMIVEDNDTNIKLFQDLLSKFKLKLTIIKDGRTAVNKFKSSIKNGVSIYNIILMDENIPNLKGSQAALEIRKIEENLDIKRTPIISVSANRYSDTNVGSLVYMDDFISKPIDIKELFSLLIKYLTNSEYTSFNNKKTKILKLKIIRDLFVKEDSSLNNVIDGFIGLFSKEEVTLLKKIKKINYNKNEFNLIYNKILKNIRKENK